MSKKFYCLVQICIFLITIYQQISWRNLFAFSRIIFIICITNVAESLFHSIAEEIEILQCAAETSGMPNDETFD